MWGQAAPWLIAMLAAGAMAQENAPPGLLQGDLIRWQGVEDQGQFTFLVFPDHVYTCSFDDRTDIERDQQRTTIDQVAKGDHLEVVADRQPGSTQCYARAVQIKTPVLPGSGLPAASLMASQSWSLPFSLSGAVSTITPAILILRLRSGAHVIVHIGSGTRYFQDGQATDRSALQANRVVFIRARKDLRGETEASQVIWGDILQP